MLPTRRITAAAKKTRKEHTLITGGRTSYLRGELSPFKRTARGKKVAAASLREGETLIDQ